jgi:O-antigen/teichoic acid export membrane protein
MQLFHGLPCMNSFSPLSRIGLNRLWHSRFVRNVVTVASGAFGAQVITMVFAPFITRVYGPEAFGLLGTFMAIVTVAIPIAAFGYPIAIVLPREDRDALALVKISLYLSILVSLLTAALIWASGSSIVSIFGAQPIGNYLLMIPLAMLFANWVQIAQQWLIRKKSFSVVARNAVGHSLILNTAKSLGYMYPSAALLITLTISSNALHTATLFFKARKLHKVERPVEDQKPHTVLMEIIVRYKDFPLYRAPQNFINAVSQSFPVFMLAALFGPVAAGFYTLANMVMGVPSNLVGKAVNDVFYPKIVEANHCGENLHRQIMNATIMLLGLSAVPFGLVALFGPWLFGAVFGSSWTTSGDYARWLALFFLFNFINKPAVAAVPVLGIQRGLLFYELLSTGSKLLGLFVGFYWLHSELWAIALFSVAGATAYIAMIMWILHRAK